MLPICDQAGFQRPIRSWVLWFISQFNRIDGGEKSHSNNDIQAAASFISQRLAWILQIIILNHTCIPVFYQSIPRQIFSCQQEQRFLFLLNYPKLVGHFQISFLQKFRCNFIFDGVSRGRFYNQNLIDHRSIVLSEFLVDLSILYSKLCVFSLEAMVILAKLAVLKKNE